MTPSQRRREIARRKRIRRLKQIRALIILAILIFLIVFGVKAVKDKISENKEGTNIEDRTEEQNKELEEIAEGKKQNKEKKAGKGEVIPLKDEKDRVKVVRESDNAEASEDDGTPARGEALNVIERDGVTNVYQDPSLQSKVIKTLKDNDTVEITEVIPGGWLKIVTQWGDEGYAEAVRIRSKKLPPHNYNKDSADYVLIVNQDTQTLELYNEGEKVLESAVSTGIESEFTPRGVFLINKKHSGEWDFASAFSEGYKYFTSFYTHGYLLHSLPMNADQEVIKEEAEKLGTPASHGCIRLPVPIAKYIYENVPHESLLIIE